MFEGDQNTASHNPTTEGFSKIHLDTRLCLFSVNVQRTSERKGRILSAHIANSEFEAVSVGIVPSQFAKRYIFL